MSQIGLPYNGFFDMYITFKLFGLTWLEAFGKCRKEVRCCCEKRVCGGCTEIEETSDDFKNLDSQNVLMTEQVLNIVIKSASM